MHYEEQIKSASSCCSNPSVWNIDNDDQEEWPSAVDEMHNSNSNCNKGMTDIVHTRSVSASIHAPAVDDFQIHSFKSKNKVVIDLVCQCILSYGGCWCSFLVLIVGWCRFIVVGLLVLWRCGSLFWFCIAGCQCMLLMHFVMLCGSVVQQCCLAGAQDDNYSIKSQAIAALGLCDIGGVLRSNLVTDFLKLRIGHPHFCVHYPSCFRRLLAMILTLLPSRLPVHGGFVLADQTKTLLPRLTQSGYHFWLILTEKAKQKMRISSHFVQCLWNCLACLLGSTS